MFVVKAGGETEIVTGEFLMGTESRVKASSMSPL